MIRGNIIGYIVLLSLLANNTIAYAVPRPRFPDELAWNKERLESIGEISTQQLSETLNQAIYTYNMIRAQIEKKTLEKSVKLSQVIPILDQAAKVARFVQVRYYVQLFQIKSRRNLDTRIPISYLIANDTFTKIQSRKPAVPATMEAILTKLWDLNKEINQARMLFESTSEDLKKTAGIPPLLYPLDTSLEKSKLYQNALNRVRALATLDVLLYNTKHAAPSHGRIKSLDVKMCCYDTLKCADARDKPVLAMTHRYNSFKMDYPYHPMAQAYSHNRATKQLVELMYSNESTLRQIRKQKDPTKKAALYHNYVSSYQNIFQEAETTLLMNTRGMQNWYGPLKTKEQIAKGDYHHVLFNNTREDAFRNKSMFQDMVSPLADERRSKISDLQDRLIYAEKFGLPRTLERYCQKVKTISLTDMAKMVTPIGGALHDQFKHYVLIPGIIQEVERQDQAMDDIAQLLAVASVVLTIIATASGVGAVFLPGTLGLASVSSFLTYASLSRDLGEISHQAIMLRKREKEWFLLSRELTHHKMYDTDMFLEAQNLHQDIEHYNSVLKSNVSSFAFSFSDYLIKTLKVKGDVNLAFEELKKTRKTFRRFSDLLESESTAEAVGKILSNMGDDATDYFLNLLKTNQGQKFLDALSKGDLKTAQSILSQATQAIKKKVLVARS